MRRIAALGVAVGLIVVALVIRNHRDEEKRLGPYRLTCATEFADACRSLPASEVTVTIEPAGVTTDRLIALEVGNDPGFDGWLAPGMWTRIMTDARRAAGAPFLSNRTLDVHAHSGLVMVGWRDRVAVLRRACPSQLTWKCVGDVAAKVTWKANGGPDAWGPVKIALPDPASESAGLAALGGAAFDVSLASTPLDAATSDAYLHWLTAVAKASARPAPDLTAMLTAGPAVADFYIGFAAPVDAIVRTSARRDQVEVSPVALRTSADGRLLTIGRQPPSRLTDALSASGWTKVGALGVPVMNETISALRQLWKDTVR